MSKDNLLTIIGKARDGRFVAAGVFSFYETYGLPLETMIDHLYYKHNTLPCWRTLVEDMVRAGINRKTAVKRVCLSLEDSFLHDPDFRKEIIRRISLLE